MEMAMARNLPPRGMKLHLSCTLLNKTPTTVEQWEQILLKASNDLVKLTHDHYTNQLEAELKHQKILLHEIKELNHHSFTRAENTNLTSLLKKTMAKHQTETATLAAQLAAKWTGCNKCKRTKSYPPPPQQAITHRRQNQKKNGEDQAPAGAKHKHTSEEGTSTETKKHKKPTHIHSRKRPHHKIY